MTLRQLLVPVGAVTLGGVALFLAVPRAGVTRADLVDAGALGMCRVAHLECQVRIATACRTLTDGGTLPRYATLGLPGLYCGGDGGLAALILRPPRAGGASCFEVVGPPDTACVLAESPGNCTDSTVCADDGGTQLGYAAVANRCACWNPDAGVCRVPNDDGGAPVLAPQGSTFGPPFAGAGCVRKVCQEVAGEQGQSWPTECPP